MTIRCYVAAPWTKRPDVRALHKRLEAIGIAPTSNWADMPGDDAECLTEDSAESAIAVNDYDIARSHVAVFLAYPNLGGESYCELARLLASRTAVLWVGTRICLSTLRPGVVRLPSLDSAIAWLVSARLDVSRPFPTSDAWKRDVLWSRAAYEPAPSIPAAPAEDADDTIPRLSLSDIYEGRT